MTDIGWREVEFPAEIGGRLYECDICGFDYRKRDTKMQRGLRVCPVCYDNDYRDREDE